MKQKKIFFLLLLFVLSSSAQDKRQIYAVAFYNLENLFDTQRDTTINDVDFTPNGSYAWTQDKYHKKLNNMSYVISQLGKEYTPDGPAVIGVSEIENQKVLEDLISTGKLASVGYGIVHYDSPDRRGIDVGLLYNPKLFTVTSSRTYAYLMPEEPDFRTRDVLLVNGILAGEDFHVIVNHWPSRRGGNKSSYSREFAAEIVKSIADSIYKVNPKSKIVIMGDLNDDPFNKSVKTVLGAKGKQKDVKSGELYNPFWQLLKKGIGSLFYQGNWNLFDQIIISQTFLSKEAALKFWKAEVFNKDFLIQKEGAYKGYPFRTFSGNRFQNGYSDHFPTIVYFEKD
ncbi:MAG: endonuclease [Bacteroidetes bacterium]|nr:endonuclease [Bacteroidota bacterium]